MSHTKRIAVGIVVLAMSAASLAEAGVLVRFREAATIDGALVTLGDLAQIDSTEPADSQRLEAVIIGPAPPAGRDAVIAFETVRSRLLAAGVDLSMLEFSGPANIAVSVDAVETETQPSTARQSVPLDARQRAEQAVTDAIGRYLSMRTAGGSFAVTANLNAADSDALLIAATRGTDVAGGEPPWIGEQVFTLRFVGSSDGIRELRVPCTVAARPSVLVAKTSLPRGHLLRPDDLVWRRAESDAEAACVTEPRELLGKETQKPLRAGEAIAHDAVKSLPLVRNGQFVTVTSRRPGLAVQRVMKARSDGIAGAMIPLVTLEDHKTVMARVTGLQQAEIVEQISPAAGTAPQNPSSGAGTILTLEHQADANPQINPAKATTAPAGEPATREATKSELPRILANPSRPQSVPADPATGEQ